MNDTRFQKLDDMAMSGVVGGAGSTGQGVDGGGVRIIYEHCPVCNPDNTQVKTAFELKDGIAKCVQCEYILLEQSSL